MLFCMFVYVCIYMYEHVSYYVTYLFIHHVTDFFLLYQNDKYFASMCMFTFLCMSMRVIHHVTELFFFII